jgi:hypothetical protein
MTHQLDPAALAAGVSWLHGRKWTGNFTALDLIAAGTNALNGALLARRPDDYKNFTIVGVLLMGHHPLHWECDRPSFSGSPGWETSTNMRSMYTARRRSYFWVL